MSTPGLSRLVAACAVSRAGDYLYNISLIVFVYSATRSMAWVAAASIARLVPAVLLGPVAGVIADRFDRRAVVVTSLLLGASAMAALALAVAGGLGPGWITLGAALAVAVTSPGRPALTALVAATVPEERRGAAASLLGVVEFAAVASGPAAGAVALLLGPAWVAFAVNGLTFLVAAALVARPGPARSVTGPSAPTEVGARSELREGLRAASRPRIRGVVGWTTAAYLLCGVQITLVAPASLRLGTGGWGAAVLEACAGIGGVLAALWLHRHPGPAGRGRTLPLAVLLNVAGLAAVVVIPTPALAWTSVALAGAGALAVDVAGSTLLMNRVPAAVLGRVEGLVGSVSVAAVIIGNAVGAGLIAALGVTGGILTGVLPLAVLAVVRLGRSGARTAGRPSAPAVGLAG